MLWQKPKLPLPQLDATLTRARNHPQQDHPRKRLMLLLRLFGVRHAITIPQRPVPGHLRVRCACVEDFRTRPLGVQAKKKKRNTPTPAKQLVRKTLGDAIKLNCDDLLLSQHFRDKERKFKREEYKFHIKPLVDSLIADSELDTSMYSRLELFDIAVDIGKKRDAYQPKNKLSPTKKRRLRQKSLKKKAAAAAAAASSSSSSSAAASSSSSSAAAAVDGRLTARRVHTKLLSCCDGALVRQELVPLLGLTLAHVVDHFV